MICHSDPERFAFLYRMLWRLRTEPNLLHIQSDPDVRRFEAMEKSVRRDIHKMRAFVRFRRIHDEGDASSTPPGSSPTTTSSSATRPSSSGASPA